MGFRFCCCSPAAVPTDTDTDRDTSKPTDSRLIAATPGINKIPNNKIAPEPQPQPQTVAVGTIHAQSEHQQQQQQPLSPTVRTSDTVSPKTNNPSHSINQQQQQQQHPSTVTVDVQPPASSFSPAISAELDAILQDLGHEPDVITAANTSTVVAISIPAKVIPTAAIVSTVPVPLERHNSDLWFKAEMAAESATVAGLAELVLVERTNRQDRGEISTVPSSTRESVINNKIVNTVINNGTIIDLMQQQQQHQPPPQLNIQSHQPKVNSSRATAPIDPFNNAFQSAFDELAKSKPKHKHSQSVLSSQSVTQSNKPINNNNNKSNKTKSGKSKPALGHFVSTASESINQVTEDAAADALIGILVKQRSLESGFNSGIEDTDYTIQQPSAAIHQQHQQQRRKSHLQPIMDTLTSSPSVSIKPRDSMLWFNAQVAADSAQAAALAQLIVLQRSSQGSLTAPSSPKRRKSLSLPQFRLAAEVHSDPVSTIDSRNPIESRRSSSSSSAAIINEPTQSDPFSSAFQSAFDSVVERVQSQTNPNPQQPHSLRHTDSYSVSMAAGASAATANPHSNIVEGPLYDVGALETASQQASAHALADLVIAQRTNSATETEIPAPELDTTKLTIAPSVAVTEIIQ